MEITNQSKFPLGILFEIIRYVISDGNSFFNFRAVSKLFYELVTNIGFLDYQEYKKKRDIAIGSILARMNSIEYSGYTIEIDQICNNIEHKHHCVFVERRPKKIVQFRLTEEEKKTSNTEFDYGIVTTEYDWVFFPLDTFVFYCRAYSNEFEKIVTGYFRGSEAHWFGHWDRVYPRIANLLKDIRVTKKLKFRINIGPETYFTETDVGLFQREGINMDPFNMYLYFNKYDK